MRSAASVPIVRVEGLEFVYPPPREIRALNGVNLQIGAGEVVALVGQNGSGKTSLARCLSGYLRPTRGRVSVAGQDISRLPPSRRARVVGYVFQNPDHQLFRESVWDEVAFGLQNLRRPWDQIEREVEAALRRLELWDKRDLHPFQLSKGDRQRLAIAAILVLSPQVLIVDEPTTGQDPRKAREIMDLLAALNRDQGTTIVAITHVMELVAEYCERMIVLHQGQVLVDGPPRVVFRQVDLLATSAISPPPICRLALRLGLEPFPLTVAEARDALLARMPR